MSERTRLRRKAAALRSPNCEVGSRGSAHLIVEAGNGDGALLVMQRGEDLRQRSEWIQSRSAIKAGMQIARRAADGDFGESETAQKCGNSRRIGIPLPVSQTSAMSALSYP